MVNTNKNFKYKLENRGKISYFGSVEEALKAIGPSECLKWDEFNNFLDNKDTVITSDNIILMFEKYAENPNFNLRIINSATYNYSNFSVFILSKGGENIACLNAIYY